MYRQWREALQRLERTKGGKRHLPSLNPAYFQFLWYVYNRGGVCNIETVESWFKLSRSTCKYHIKQMAEGGWLTALFAVNTYARKDHKGWNPTLYRVSTRFLRCVGNPDATIRKISSVDKAASLLGVTNYFLLDAQRTFTLINRRDRGRFLVERCGLNEEVFPKYFVNKYKEGEKQIISINQEVIHRDDEIFILWTPGDAFGTNFVTFENKWTDFFKVAKDIKVLGLSVNGATQRLLAKHATTTTERRNYMTSGLEARHKRRQGAAEKNQRPFKLVAAHYPDVWQRYTNYPDALNEE